MADLQSWLDEVERKLVGDGIPAAQRRRLLIELQDHYEDCRLELANQSEQRSAKMADNPIQLTATERTKLEERLGTPAEIATAAKTHPLPATFVARHPWLVFACTPLPLLLAIFAGYGLALGAILSVWDWRSHVSPGQLPWWGYGAVYGFIYVPVTLAALTLTWIAARHRVGLRWWLASLTLPLLIAAHSQVLMSLSQQPGQSRVNVGIGFPPSSEGLWQFLVPLAAATAAWILLTRRQAHRPIAGELGELEQPTRSEAA